jgi:hypothetical protein
MHSMVLVQGAPVKSEEAHPGPTAATRSELHCDDMHDLHAAFLGEAGSPSGHAQVVVVAFEASPSARTGCRASRAKCLRIRSHRCRGAAESSQGRRRIERFEASPWAESPLLAAYGVSYPSDDARAEVEPHAEREQPCDAMVSPLPVHGKHHQDVLCFAGHLRTPSPGSWYRRERAQRVATVPAPGATLDA